MRAARWMVMACVAVWLAIAAWLDQPARVAVLLGMCAPLAMAAGSWVLAERTYRQNPTGMTSLMIAAFGFKVVFFGAYVVVMLALLPVSPVPFVTSFVGFFVGLYLVEALMLRRLFLGGRS